MKTRLDGEAKMERDNVIRAKRGRMSVAELAKEYGLTRQSIHVILKKQSPMQLLLDRCVYHQNKVYELHQKIVALRGVEKPFCFGEDDCSTECLSHCAWRDDCGRK